LAVSANATASFVGMTITTVPVVAGTINPVTTATTNATPVLGSNLRAWDVAPTTLTSGSGAPGSCAGIGVVVIPNLNGNLNGVTGTISTATANSPGTRQWEPTPRGRARRLSKLRLRLHSHHQFSCDATTCGPTSSPALAVADSAHFGQVGIRP
jgi:hypothetical protein